MDLRQLYGFTAVAREGSYAAAASSLALSQPAVWRQVKDLEQELQLRLFEKQGRRVRLTTDGRRLLDLATAVLDTVERFTSTAADLRSIRAGVVAVACASTHLERFLAHAIGVFREAHPGVAFVIREYGGGAAPGRGIREDLLDGVVDVATLVGPHDDPDVEGFPVYDVQLVLAVPDDHPWRRLDTIEVSHLRGKPLIVGLPSAYSRRSIEAACSRSGFEATIAFVVASPVSQVALGRAGLGLPVTVDDSTRAFGDTAWPKIVEHGIPLRDTVRLVWRSGAALSPSARAFIDIVRGEAH
jgi:DNA-binding transcriptional LysR family regulator